MLASDFKGRKTYLWGTGVEGQAMAEWWKANFPGKDLPVIEDNEIPGDAEIIIKSPGVSVYLPQYKAAQERGVKFTSLMNVFLSNLEAQSKKPIVIGITGTKGKSTTASLLAFMLERLGVKVGLGGNIGAPPLDFLGRHLDYIVLELSSFQITDLEHDLDYGVIVNISQAHVDWHMTLENYVSDKLKIKKRAKKLVVNGKDERLGALADVSFYGLDEGFSVRDGRVCDGGTELELPELQVRGEHNLYNLCAALTILKELRMDYRKVLPALAEFKALEHRLQQVHAKNGFVFIDDSIATVPDSTIAAINSFDDDVAVIVGGYDNKPDYSKLDAFITATDKIKVVLCLPDTGSLLKTPKGIPVKTMDEAVKKAVAALDGKGVVLLSPAAPSYNMYKSYKERGNDFARIAQEVV